MPCSCSQLVAQYLFFQLVMSFGPPEWRPTPAAIPCTLVTSADDASVASCVRSLMQSLNSDVDNSIMRVKQQYQYFNAFNPIAYSTVGGMLVQGNEHHFFIPKPILDQVTSLQATYLSSLRLSYDDAQYGTEGGGSDASAAAGTDAAASSPADTAVASTANFQQKIDVSPLTQLSALGDITADPQPADANGDDDDATSSSVTLRDAVTQRTSAVRQSVIVVASLVGKLPNLAGLSRTCEIFQAESLMVADASVVHERDFKSVSVTAHKWLPIHELKPNRIADFMRAKQAEGYTCIALEQSAASIKLTEYQFPPRLVIILGAEKEGVPVELLNIVDHCVEIPQLGIIRSGASRQCADGITCRRGERYSHVSPLAVPLPLPLPSGA